MYISQYQQSGKEVPFFAITAKGGQIPMKYIPAIQITNKPIQPLHAKKHHVVSARYVYAELFK